MRKINILTEDYVQLETAFGSCSSTVENEYASLRNKINEAIFEYENSNMGPEAYMDLRYSPIFEELTNFKYRSTLAEVARRIHDGTSISLAESTTISFIFKEKGYIDSKDEFCSSTGCFGSLTESDIPVSTDGIYDVTYTQKGRDYACKNLAKLQESVVEAYSELKSIDPSDIRNALMTLAEAYIVGKGN